MKLNDFYNKPSESRQNRQNRPKRAKKTVNYLIFLKINFLDMNLIFSGNAEFDREIPKITKNTL